MDWRIDKATEKECYGCVTPLLSHLILRRAVVLLPLMISSCILTKPAADSNANSAPLKLSAPKMRSDQKVERENWISLQSTEGKAFAQAKEGMDDVVALSATESPLGQSITTLEAAESALRARNPSPLLKVRRSEILGEACLRFEQRSETSSAENTSLRTTLGARGRTMPGPFISRTLGAVFLHPTKKGQYVTLLCNRTSYHGEIGAYYEELFDDFLYAFVAENYMNSTPYGNL